MKKRISQTAVITFSTSLLLLGNLPTNIPQFPEISFGFQNTWAKENKETKKVKGKINNISQKAKTIALTAKEQGLIFFKFTEKTQLKDLSSPKELKAGEAILVEYQIIDGENVITSLQKALVKLPAGTSKITTEKLAAMLKEKANSVTLIDARPKVRYAKGHITDAISIPYATLKKEGDKGAKILEKYKDQQLVFYCGGST